MTAAEAADPAVPSRGSVPAPAPAPHGPRHRGAPSGPWSGTRHRRFRIRDAQADIRRQTVRYRLRQVEDLFGDKLRDPDRRFELEIALRARQMLRRKRP